MSQLEKKAAKDVDSEGAYESSEPTSITNSSTVEGEHTIQNPESEDDRKGSSEGGGDNNSLSESNEAELPSDDGRKNRMGTKEPTTPLISDTTSSNATTPGAESSGGEFAKEVGRLAQNDDEIQLLQLRLQEAQCRNMVIEAEMNELKARVRQWILFWPI